MDAIAGWCLLNCVQWLLVVKRFGKKVCGAQLHRFHRHRNIAVSGDKNDRNLKTCVLKLSLKIWAAHAWQGDVQYEELGPSQSPLFRNCSAVSKLSDCRLADFSRPCIDARIRESSSTTNTMDDSVAIRNLIVNGSGLREWRDQLIATYLGRALLRPRFLLANLAIS